MLPIYYFECASIHLKMGCHYTCIFFFLEKEMEGELIIAVSKILSGLIVIDIILSLLEQQYEKVHFHAKFNYLY